MTDHQPPKNPETPGAKPGSAAPAPAGTTPADDARALDVLGRASLGLNLAAEAYRRGRFGINDLEAAFDKLPVLASGSAQALRGVDLQEMVRVILTRVSELRVRAQADGKSTDLFFVNIRPQTQRCAELFLRQEFASRDAMFDLCQRLEVPAAPEDDEAALVHKLNDRLTQPGLVHSIASYLRDHPQGLSAPAQKLMTALQENARQPAPPDAHLAAAHKRLITEIFATAFKKEHLEMDRAAVLVDVELAVSAEAMAGAAFQESDFRDLAVPEVARLLGVDLTPREKGRDLSDKEILEGLNRRIASGEWLRPFRNYLTAQRQISELASRLHNALIRYPHAQLFLGRRLIMEVLAPLFTHRPAAESGYRDTVVCPAYVVDHHQLDLSPIPFHLNLTADGARGFARYLHAQQISLLDADGQGYRIDMGKPSQVERVQREGAAVSPVGLPSTNRLEVDAVRMRAAKIVGRLNRLWQKLVGVTQGQLLAGINELTPDERYYLDRLLLPIVAGGAELNSAELSRRELAFELGPILGVAARTGEAPESLLLRVNAALRDYACIANLVRYCRSNGLYAAHEKTLREIERMRNGDKLMSEIAPKIKELIRQLRPDGFRRNEDIRFEDLLSGYTDLSAFLRDFLLDHTHVLRNLSEFVTGWQDTLGTELAFIQKTDSGYVRE